MSKILLKDIISYKKGNAFKSTDYQKDGVAIVRVSDFENDTINLNNLYYVSKEVADKNKNVILNKYDVVVTTVGASAGNFIRVPEMAEGYLLNQNAVRLRINSDEKFEKIYLFYALKYKKFTQYLLAGAQGSAQPSIVLDQILNAEIPYPKKDRRKYISEVLFTLDEKIELNTQINQTLEQIAQTIFKSWFIDFDPVHAKANALANGQTAEQATQAAMAVISGKNTQELHRLQTANPEQYQQLWEIAEAFPSGFDEEGVPRGWEMTTFGNVSQCFDKKRIPLSKRQREQRAGSIPYYGATSVMDYVDEAIFDDIYLLIGEDGSVLKEDGSPFIQYIWGKAWVNNHAHVLQGKGSVSTEQLMLFMASTNITAYVTGAVQMKLNQANMNSIPFVKATDRVNELFFDLIKDLYAKIRSNTDENRFLVKIRDELLPKLLSGKV
ncbi:restriction endonuclease subunit S [Actinobacillus porcinus]|uniref:restriction endonuclease subunit S n=1 Tax=Actinobacillus porcinus TaxID=51048 RepID=UPI002A914160|nr:restriction endonuclease subunit S [Actinobacillus porcinus]MDY5848184.1 restriction endonuclease subunit S [Actinobacillus porcinus]